MLTKDEKRKSNKLWRHSLLDIVQRAVYIKDKRNWSAFATLHRSVKSRKGLLYKQDETKGLFWVYIISQKAQTIVHYFILPSMPHLFHPPYILIWHPQRCHHYFHYYAFYGWVLSFDSFWQAAKHFLHIFLPGWQKEKTADQVNLLFHFIYN